MSTPLRATVLNKGTVYETLQPEERESPPERFPSAHWDAVVRAHERHQWAVERLRAALEELGWEQDWHTRDSFEGPDGHDLVISLGGDGTVLMAAQKTIGVPLLGINSDPERSTGYFCAAPVNDAHDILGDFASDTLEHFEMARLKVEIDGREAGPPALNDVLMANANPAATSRYMLIAGQRAERQRSSGLWISTPAGSTAGIRSAGGVVLPLAGNQLQYLVREPVFSPGQHYELLRGVRALEEGIRIVSYMADGYVYIDGPYVEVPFPLGSELRISAHESLTLLGLQPDRRER